MLDKLFGLGGLLGGVNPEETAAATAEAKAPSYTEGWRQFLSDPKTQAMLMSAGTQLMQPRWNKASALPDALNAAGNAAATEQSYQDAKAQQEADNEGKAATLAQRASEGEADRANRLATAKIGADSRAEVAGMRAESMLDRARLSTTIRTPFEQKEFSKKVGSYFGQERTEWGKDLANLGKSPSPELEAMWKQKAETRAHQDIVGARLYSGPGLAERPAGNAPATSENRAPSGAAVPQGQPGRGVEKPSGNAGNTSNINMGSTVKELKEKFTATEWEAMLADTKGRVELQKRLKPGEQLGPRRGKLNTREQIEGF